MNCQDISRIADTGRIGALTAAERQAAEAHVHGCSRCAAVWSAHVRLMALDTPLMPAEVSLRLQAMTAMPAGMQGRYPLRRLTVIGVVALAAAAGILLWSVNRAPPPVAAPVVAGVPRPDDDAAPISPVVPPASPEPAFFAASATDSGSEAAMCTQTYNEMVAFAVMEMEAAYPTLAAEVPAPEGQAAQLSDERLHAKLRELQRGLAVSRDPDALLAALLVYPPERHLAEDPVARAMLVDLGVRAAAAGSPLLAWHALRACVEAAQACPYEHLVPGLVEADKQNAEAWALLAASRYRRGDMAGALAALQGAARAPTSTWHWAESSTAIERALATGTNMPYPERIATAFGSTAATLPSVVPSTMCKAESPKNRAWAEACLALGTLRTAHGDTTLALGLGYSMREQALAALGDTQGAAQAAAEYALFDAQRLGGRLAPVGLLHTALLESDPARLRGYLGAVQLHGEGAGARMFLRQQLPPLMARAGLLEREGARECAARLFEPRMALDTRAATAARQVQVADELMVSVRNPVLSTVVQVRPDGTFVMPLSTAVGDRSTQPRQSQVVAVGKTPGQLQEEIAMLFARRGQPPRVFVIPLAPRSREELRREFDNALREDAQGRD